jgi:hypothetical protein
VFSFQKKNNIIHATEKPDNYKVKEIIRAQEKIHALIGTNLPIMGAKNKLLDYKVSLYDYMR